MSRKYKSKVFQEMYDSFSRMFKEEGDCYDTILQSLEADYDHHETRGKPPKVIVMNVLQDVSVDYYKDKVEILTENQYLKNEATQV